MQITCNRDEIIARMNRYYSAIEEERIEIAKVQIIEQAISNLKNELYYANMGITLAGNIQNSCLDDVAWLQQFSSHGRECDSNEYLNTEITKGWRLRK